ncbi:MAG: response regulator transcription factor [Chloroflexi bacterium]|nr:response regulator transcription factor [Chloroflexota bacterium]
MIVDDHPPLRAGVRAILEKTPDIYVIGEAGSGEEAEKLLDELRPKIILLDLKMPNFSPLAFEKWARENYPETITLVLTAHDRDAYLASMMEAGAVGFLDKESRAEQLIEAIRRAAHGEYLITNEQLIRARNWKKEAGEKWEKLTEREREVLLLMEKGLSNKAIAKRVGVTLKTVAYHVSAIFDRLDVESRHEAAAWYQKYFPKDLE